MGVGPAAERVAHADQPLAELGGVAEAPAAGVLDQRGDGLRQQIGRVDGVGDLDCAAGVCLGCLLTTALRLHPARGKR